jgi:hypothetical protein
MPKGIQDSNLQIAVGKLPQTDFVTATAAAAGAYIEQVITSKNFIKREVPTANNKGQTTGNRIATESWVSRGLMTSFSMPFDVTFQNIGRYLNAVCGSATPSAAAALFRNLFRLLDTKITSQLPAYSILEQAAPANGGLDVKAPSMVGKSLKLSGDGTARCQGVMEWIGSGEYVQPSGIVWTRDVTPTQGTQVCVYNTTSKLVRSDAPGGGNAVTKSLCENLGWDITITNTFDEKDYGCPRLFDPADISKGVLRSQLLLMDTEITSNWKFKLPQNSTEMSLLENQAPLKLLFSLLSTETLSATSQVLNFDMPLNKYKTVDYSSENGFIYLTIVPENLFSVSANKALEVELINNIQNYN